MTISIPFDLRATPGGTQPGVERAPDRDFGHSAGTAALADAALARARGRVDHGTEALLLITAARANGASGNRAAAAKLIVAAGTYHSMRGTTLADIAKTVAAQHRPEEAVQLWTRSLDLMDGVASHRNQLELRTVQSTAASYARRGIRGAAALSQRAARLRTT
ncbi:hypothetical protein [Streptomyces sp. TLI_171]|uniref:hypothetical protein n=1 Tax=Streptomyces sp. TLI_171 TaxID=1938859 RepID=UPI000C182CC9|nr:hypothetical protein [Streptomyces sp. TLI_171]RKE02873.1 hypothetical protein BX266_7475 [Streptomyces sp. TLI_171]